MKGIRREVPPFHALVDLDLARAGMREALAGFLRHVRKSGWRTTIFPGGALNHGGFAVGAFDALREPIGGVVGEYRDSHAVVWALERGLPAVPLFEDGERTELDVLCGARAADHLARRGLPAFAFAGSAGGENWSEARRRGFETALAARGLAVLPALPPPSGPDRAAAAADPGRRLAAWLSSLPKPVGIYVAEDGLARRLAETCGLLGLDLPGDVAVVGTGNDEILCRSMRPTLSSVGLDFAAFGEAAAAALGRAAGSGGPGRAKPGIEAVRLHARASSALPAASRSNARTVVRRCIAILRDRAAEPLPVDSVAAELGVSRRTLETRFLAATGRTVAAARLAARLDRARALLASTQLSVEEIAARSGFHDASHLSHAFRRRFGSTPSSFRRTSL